MNWLTRNGTPVGPAGQGTWYLGEKRDTFERECSALRQGVEAGMNLIDTAEMYGEGAAERLIGKAVSGAEREGLFIVSKVYPHNAGRRNIFHACEASLKRLGTDYLDLYLLHWRGSVPLAETVECMEELKHRGLILNWGVSNLDTGDMKELVAVDGGDACFTDQVLYHLGSRGIEYDLLPWLQKREIPVMAYCPLAQAGRLRNGLMRSDAVKKTAEKYSCTPSQVLLAFLLKQKDVIPIPRSSRPEHTLENAKAAKINLDADSLALLDRAFPAPSRKTSLDIV